MTFSSGPLPPIVPKTTMPQPVSVGRIVLIGDYPAIVVRVHPATDVVDAFLFAPENMGFIEGVEYSYDGWRWPPRVTGAAST